MMNAGPVAIAVLGAALALTPVPAYADVPPPGSVSVALTALYGSGCPQGTVMIDSKVESFSVRYSAHLAAAGAGQPPTSFRKNCRIDLEVSHPPEFTYGIARAEHRGYGELQEGASGLVRSSFSFYGRPLPMGREYVVHGPYSDAWRFVDESGIPEVPVKPCDSPSANTLVTDLRVNAGTSDRSKVSFMVLDGTDHASGSTYHFSWKRC